MPVTPRTRKPIVKLTIADLRAFPIWKYAIDEEGVDGQDETWVRPVVSDTIPKGAYSLIVASDFTTPAGKKLQGFMDVTTAKAGVEIQPGAVVGRIGYRLLPHLTRKLAVRKKVSWEVEARDRLLLAIGQADADVFPLRYELRVPIRGEKQARAGAVK